MGKPVILAVDDDPMVSAAIAHDLRGRHGAEYRIMRAAPGPEALAVLARQALRDQPVALIVADQRMPRMTGIEMLKQARGRAQGAKYLLLTGRHWPLPRPPFTLGTSVPGVFAAGDMRLDSMKRAAPAVGEGAMSIYLVHRYLATI